MKINIYVIIIIVCIVLIGLLCIKKESYMDYSEYNTIDRIQTLDGDYAYCIAGKVQCVSGNLIELSDKYTGGKTYKSLCGDNNSSPVECTNNFQYDLDKLNQFNLDWKTSTARQLSFPFSDQHRGFTIPYSYIPIDIKDKYINFYDACGNLLDNMHKCDMLKTTQETEQCYKDIKCEKPIQCIADNGTDLGDPLCCGQQGVLQKSATKYVCPTEKPTCAGYVCGEKYGKCK